jgi:hypothetical protein
MPEEQHQSCILAFSRVKKIDVAKDSDSAVDTHEGSRFECLQVVEQIGHKRGQVGNGGATRHKHKYCKWQIGEILLVLKILVGRDHGIERGGRRSQKRAVLYAGPAHALH